MLLLFSLLPPLVLAVRFHWEVPEVDGTLVQERGPGGGLAGENEREPGGREAQAVGSGGGGELAGAAAAGNARGGMKEGGCDAE